MNRLDDLLEKKKNNVVSVFYTAGFPQLDDTLAIAAALEKEGADLLEIGMPYSDPLADGPVIQRSSEIALKNGMSIRVLFSQLSDLRKQCKLPVLLMGYYNPLMQFGLENFCRECQAKEIDGLIIPDMPLDEAQRHHALFRKYNLHFILLLTPQTNDERIRRIDALSTGFIYMVSSASTTGKSAGFSDAQLNYFRKIKDLQLKHPVLAGFGIHDGNTFRQANEHARGAIIGSFFIRLLEKHQPEQAAKELINALNIRT